ncbi:MAG: hypothetical protein D6770_02185 [Anaerolineae bacterium]|nr:MAG: hypothetical protein D6770_02185 [Anaerolineae bacterium]
MLSGWTESLLGGIQTINQILTAGIAITAFSLFLYALTFNLRDRVARSFAVILLCVVVIFTTDALQAAQPTWVVDLLLRLQWFGIVFLPAGYLHLSDALLMTVGRPSRGRRRAAVRLVYLLSAAFLLLHGAGLLVGDLVPDGEPAPYLQRTLWTEIFTLYYAGVMLWAAVNFWRAFRHTLTRVGRRRMVYLMAGASAPALGSYPFLLYGSGPAARFPLLFWSAVTVINLALGGLIVVMAYAVAFFGVSWPDRVVKSRLFKWLLRGPVTASVTLGAMTVVRRTGEALGVPYSAAVPLVMVVTVLSLEHLITLVSPLWERWLFFGQDRDELRLWQNIEERLLTQGDLRQFLEAILAAVRDLSQSPCAFVAALDGDRLSTVIVSGERDMLAQESLSSALQATDFENGRVRKEFTWGDFLILPLLATDAKGMGNGLPSLLGILGVARRSEHPLDAEQRRALWLLADRAAMALEDRRLQQRVFHVLEGLRPQVEIVQRLRAAGRYDSRTGMLSDELPPEADLAHWVKDALSHYWGGPKLTKSPLMRLQVVKEMAEAHDGNAVNALRAVLRKAVDYTRPQGQRRFTAEWILYNILEMKFIEGRKVREVAARLAMSEADLYRKQRVAIEAVAKAILEMEARARKGEEVRKED